MSEGPWAVSLEHRADKDIERLDKKLRQRIVSAIETLAEDPDAPAQDLRKLKGRSDHRLRVGEWRVLLTLDRRTRAIIA